MTIETDNSEHARFAELNALAGVLPYHRRDELSALLSDADVATLRHLVESGMGANTLRAIASDLAYLERWALAATGSPLPWPAPASLVVKFIAHHLWDAVKKEADSTHGMPDEVASALRAMGTLKSTGPHAPGTVKRRLSLWGSMHKWRGLSGPFGDGQFRTALRLSVRAAARPRQRKSEKAVTGDIVAKLIGTCWLNRPQDLRDKALLLIAFASGGRRRSEVASLRVEDIVVEADIPADPSDSNSPRLPCRRIRLGRTKTTHADEDASAFLIGQPVQALEAWLAHAKIASGPVFRRIDQWENIRPEALTGQGVNLILKRRVAMAGLDPALYSAHGLRSGFLTEAARQGVSLPEAMAQSQHISV
ncbi:MAG: site-specific integrase, partial [Hyphomonas sp.]|nr:site-specific integrase [Hyphomonas sp.]